MTILQHLLNSFSHERHAWVSNSRLQWLCREVFAFLRFPYRRVSLGQLWACGERKAVHSRLDCEWYPAWEMVEYHATRITVLWQFTNAYIGMILKILYSIRPGQKHTRTRSSLGVEMAPSSSSISPWMSSLFNHGKSIIGKCFRYSGTWLRKIHSLPVRGMVQSRSYVLPSSPSPPPPPPFPSLFYRI